MYIKKIMKNTKFIENLNKIGLFIGGGIGYHIIDRGMTYLDNKAEAISQSVRDEKLDHLVGSVETIKNEARIHFNVLKECSEAYVNRPNGVSVSKEVMLQELSSIKDNTKSIMEQLLELGPQNWDKTTAYEECKDVLVRIDNLVKIIQNDDQINKFSFDFSQFYVYLDSLTFLQESCLLHIIMFFVLIFTVINILSVLFGNEIIRYFKLEERFPRLSLFFKLRITFQRYYLMWNVFILFVVCLSGICIDIFLFSL
uniref:LAGLIDADG homing endonuclease n=1 Tax=Pappia fissilis TaxID=1040649 RepID=UPI002A828E5A|nr:LAGLIDADG homing endonuclease [Pappia fissilis]WOX61272.1 LAGLIDADG homing endonuclease [Pappia fissilis]